MRNLKAQRHGEEGTDLVKKKRIITSRSNKRKER